MKRYFEKDSQYACVITEDEDHLVFVYGEIGQKGEGKRAFASSWIADTVAEMMIKDWIKDGYTEKTYPETEIQYYVRTFADHLKAAIENKDSVKAVADQIADQIGDFKASKEIFELVDKLIEKWGFEDSVVKMVAALSLIGGSKKALEKICDKYNIKEILSKNKEIKETLFFEIQTITSEYYNSEASGLPTKGLVKKVAKKLAYALDLFGYGIHYEGLKTIIRVFSNGAVEGIFESDYTSNMVYDANEYPYYDSQENEELFLNQFWAEIHMDELLK